MHTFVGAMWFGLNRQMLLCRYGMELKRMKPFVYICCPAFVHPFLRRIESSDIGSRLARGIFWSLLGSVISRGLVLCATVIVARTLGKVVFGELGIIQSTVGTFGIFAGFGLGITATKHVAEFRKTDPGRAGRFIGLSGIFAMSSGGLMAIVLFGLSPWLAEHSINAPQLTNVLRIGSLILFVDALNGAQTGALAGFEAFKTIAVVNFVVGLLSFPVLIVGAYWGGLEGTVWALVINLIINWGANHYALRKEAERNSVPFTLKGCLKELHVLWQFSLPAVLAGSMIGPVNWVCSAMLVNQPGGYGEMGVYNAANQWFSMMMFLPSVLGNVLLPLLSEQIGQKRTVQSTKTLIVSIKINLIVVAPLVLVSSILSHYIMGLYGNGFEGGWLTLVVILFTAGILAVQAPVGQIVAASGRMWLGFIMNMGWAVVFVVGTYLMIGDGSLGLSLARLLSYIAHSLWTFAFFIYLIKKGGENDI